MTMQQEVPQSASGLAYSENADLSKPVNSTGLDPKTELRMVVWAKNQFQNMKQDRARIEQQWYLNLCFYGGKQNVAIRKGTAVTTSFAGQFYVPPAPYYRVRHVVNRVRTIVRTEISKLTAQKPTAYVLPATSDDEDLFAAQAAEQIWESKYKSAKLPAVFRRAIWWNQVCGNAFVRSAWDPDATDKDSDQIGDMAYEAVTPFHLFVPDLTEEDLEKQPFIIYAQLHTHDYVKMHYPEAKVQTQADQRSEIMDDKWLDNLSSQNVQNRRGVLCLEVWAKPGMIKEMPNGGMFLVVGDSIVTVHDGWPYDHGEYPFSKLSNIPSGKFYTDSIMVDLIPIQREYNRTRSQIIEAKNRMAKPQLRAEKGSIDPAKITSEPGQVIEYNTGYQPPEPLPLVPIPNYVLQELDRILQDMADISGQHEVSNGQVPPGITAATAINYLQEQDDSIMSYAFASLEEAYENVAYMTLCYAKQFWDTPRMVKVAGNNESFDVLMLKGANLKGNTDVTIEAGSALPISKAAKQAFIMDLMQMGFIDPAVGLEVMEMGGISKVYESVKIDVRQAQRENLRLARIDDETFQQFQQAGQEASIVPVNSWDNHMSHIDAHNRYRKSQAYDNLSQGAKIAFEVHVQQHQIAMAQGLTGESITEMLKPESMSSMGSAESGGGNQFTTADQIQKQESADTAGGGGASGEAQSASGSTETSQS